MAKEPEDLTFLTWLGARALPDFGKSRLLGGFAGLVLGAIVIALIVGATATLVQFLVAALGFGTFATGVRHEAIRNIGLVLGGFLGAPFVVWRAIVAQKTVNVTEQSHITDRISKAVEQLGAEKTIKTPNKDAKGKDITIESTVPNIEVRIGGIYALERIAQDSMTFDRGRDHIPIMEILCAYIRENAPATVAKHGHEGARDGDVSGWVASLPIIRTDIQTALTVIGRRSPAQIARERATATGGSEVGFRLDLRGTNLQRCSVPSLDFQNALLTRTYLQGANLSGARLDGADLALAGLEVAILSHAHLERANLFGARLGAAELKGALLVGAVLRGSRLAGAELSEANLQDSDLSGANLESSFMSRACLMGADLRHTRLIGADLTGARLDRAVARGIDLRETGISSEQLIAMFGDASIILPGGKDRNNPDWPAHWPKEVLDDEAFETQWRAWQKSIGYTPRN